MRVDGVGREGIQGGVAVQTMDSVSKNLRAQIANAQKQLQELAANKDMEPEEKMERRKEIQQRITDLNTQLRQHEVELRQEKQKQVKSAESRKQESERKAEDTQGSRISAGMSQGSMEAMISADRTLGQAKVQGNIKSAMKARANVLKSEIEHSGRGAAVEKKQESVADIEAQLEKIAKEQAQNLNRAARELGEAEKNAREERKVEKQKENKDTEHSVAGTGKSTDTEIDNGKVSDTGKMGETDGNTIISGERKSQNHKKENEKEEENSSNRDFQVQMPVYRKVDILL